MSRYQVRKSIERAGARGQVFEVYDKETQSHCALQVCSFGKESEVKCFVERLQLESLDTESRLFLKLRDVALSLPGRLAIIEEFPRSDLWTECQKVDWSTNLAAKIADVANAVLSGLCRLHAHGRAHCGVSPLTVCLALDGAWKLSSLESAKRVSALTPNCGPTGTTVPPEVILGLPLTEKVDVWQLAVTLCEVIVRRRIGDIVGGSTNVTGSTTGLVSLVNFLGPLPEGLVARHPNRELLFTPEGHVLRPVTPSSGEHFEAIEPEKPPVTATDKSGGGRFPRPWLVVEALAGVEGAEDILEFLGHLLNPDPEQRPSATEAMAHHFLRFAHTKVAAKAGHAEEGKSVKVGFENGGAPAGQPAAAGSGGGKIARKGTGFVHVGELPPSDDEDEDEEEDAPRQAPGQVSFKSDRGAGKQAEDAGGKLTRKGTGFVHVGELPPSDDEDEEDDEQAAPAKHVHMADSSSGGAPAKEPGGKIARKGTGFVHVGELPPSDDEDEDYDDPAPQSNAHVQFKNDAAVAQGKAGGSKMTRKGTGFVHVGELPPSDDEDDDDEAAAKKVQIKENPKDPNAATGGGLQRKGTGFVHAGELPASDDEDDEDEEDDKPRGGPKKVAIAGGASASDKDGKIQRKGTGFVHVGELPPSDDEDEDDEEEVRQLVKKVQLQDNGAGLGVKKAGGGVQRKGTGFVTAGELPDDDDDEDDEDEDEDANVPKKTHFAEEAQQKAQKGSSKPVRKGTGFVNASDLPDSDDDEDDEEETTRAGSAQHVDFKEDPSQLKSGKAGVTGKVQRKGTGFVHASDICDTDEEDEDD